MRKVIKIILKEIYRVSNSTCMVWILFHSPAKNHTTLIIFNNFCKWSPVAKQDLYKQGSLSVFVILFWLWLHIKWESGNNTLQFCFSIKKATKWIINKSYRWFALYRSFLYYLFRNLGIQIHIQNYIAQNLTILCNFKVFFFFLFCFFVLF